MKNIIYCFLAISGIIFITSCKGILNEEPKSSISVNNFYKNKQDAIAAVNDAYARLKNFPHDFPAMSINLSDESVTQDFGNADVDQLTFYNYTPANSIIGGLWTGNYRIINITNNIIKRVPKIGMDKKLKNRLVGEALFLRGFSYFRLVKAFGSVPLVLKPTTNINNLDVSRSSTDSVYAQIFADLKAAASALPLSYDKQNVGRSTKGAAESMLAKAYLFHKDWKKAADEAKKVIDSKQYSLFKDYANKWKPENRNKKEFIFSIQYGPHSHDNPLTYITMPRGTGIAPKNFGTCLPTSSIINSFSPTDYRKQSEIKTSYTFPDGHTIHFKPHFWKYFTKGINNKAVLNTPIIAYDNVLLIYAEAIDDAQGPTKEAYNAINKIRKRAHLKNLPLGISQKQFRKAVWRERKWELAFEGHRTWNLIRTGRFVEAVKASGKPIHGSIGKRNTKLPIPQQQIDTDPNITQNPGW
jgi:hypothetical protein